MKKEISFHNKFLTLRLEWIIGKYRFVPSAMLPFSPNHILTQKRRTEVRLQKSFVIKQNSKVSKD
ncbi:MAG: hypothetical protein H0X72_07090 [Acidobacteria bacterium]|nr:hypothetical protein [Acidobacteriota bacterium]